MVEYTDEEVIALLLLRLDPPPFRWNEYGSLVDALAPISEVDDYLTTLDNALREYVGDRGPRIYAVRRKFLMKFSVQS